MLIRRSLRRGWSGVLACAVLFTQLVTTAHACPLAGAMNGASARAAMPCAEMSAEMSTGASADRPELAALGVCQQHCQFGTTQQPAEPMQVLLAAVAMPALLFVLVVAPPALHEAPAWQLRERGRERAPPLALSVAHCCFRI